jgi:hypothetical protein
MRFTHLPAGACYRRNLACFQERAPAHPSFRKSVSRQAPLGLPVKVRSR